MGERSMYEKYDRYIVSYMNARKVMDNLLNKGIIDEFQKKKVLETTYPTDRNVCLLGILAKESIKEDLFLTSLKETKCKDHEQLLKLLKPNILPQLKKNCNDHEKSFISTENERKESMVMEDRIKELERERDELKQKLKEKEKDNSELVDKLKKRIEDLEREKGDLEKKLDFTYTKIREMEEKFEKDKREMEEKRQMDKEEMEEKRQMDKEDMEEKRQMDKEDMEEKRQKDKEELEKKRQMDKEELEKKRQKDKEELGKKRQKDKEELEKKHEDDKKEMEKNRQKDKDEMQQQIGELKVLTDVLKTQMGEVRRRKINSQHRFIKK